MGHGQVPFEGGRSARDDVGATPRGFPDDGAVDGVDGQAQGPAPTGGYAGKAARTGGVVGLSLPDVVHRFKSFTTARYRHGVQNDGWTPFPGRLWQRNYYEHIIRNDDELSHIRQYIAGNPARWAMDRYHSKAVDPPEMT